MPSSMLGVWDVHLKFIDTACNIMTSAIDGGMVEFVFEMCECIS